MRYDTISVEALQNYMVLFSRLVKAKINQKKLRRFALELDGWSHIATHSIAIFATFTTNNSDTFDTVLLTLAPMENESSLGASEHRKV